MPFALHFILVALCAAALAVPFPDRLAEARALHDPVARADLELKARLTPQGLQEEVDAALRAGDMELVESFAELAQERGLSLRSDQQDRLDAFLSENPAWRAARDFGDGFARGSVQSGAATSGALAADLSGFGDLRDLAREGGRWLDGGEADALVIGLSAAGLAVTAATWSSLGAALPVRGGLSLTKALQKTGRLSKPLALALSRTAATSVDREAMRAAASAVTRLEFGAARTEAARLLRPQAVAQFRELGADVSNVYRRAGAGAAQDVLSVAASRSEVKQAARLAAAKGSKTRAILKTLGRGVLLAGSLSLTLAGWAFTFVAWFFALASFARRLGESIGRVLWSVADRARAATKFRAIATRGQPPDLSQVAK